ncbi:MAG: AraC family transcriptional regulator [Lachnospiraceae bacterium]|nr:AraC family transcriptional regulator [Lachnospiraceae bacterium]
MLKSGQDREIIQYNDFKDVGMSYESSPCTFPAHWHLSAEFILVHKNGCRYEVNNSVYTLNSGEILLVWPAEVHAVVDTPQKASMILQFSSEIISHLKDIDLISNRLRSLHLITKKDGILHETLSERINSCYRLYHSNDLFVETQIKMRIVEMLHQIALNAVAKPDTEASSSGNLETYYKVQQACAYMIENCAKDISQKEVADHVNFSVYYFSRIFREYTMESFNQFLTRHRLEKAVKLLASDNISITDVAFLSGFQSISNFNKTFLKNMGCSPKEYRKLRQSTPGRE